MTIQRPRAQANPAANAAVWPKLRVNWIDAHARVARVDLRQPRERRVLAAVVDQDDLVRNAERRERGGQLLVQRQRR